MKFCPKKSVRISILNPRQFKLVAMSKIQLAEEINNYIGLSTSNNHQDFISKQTVDIIVSMNSICAYFEI